MKRSKRKCTVTFSWAADLLHPSGHELRFLHSRWSSLAYTTESWQFLQVCLLWTMVMKLGSLCLWRQFSHGWGNEKTCIQDDYVNRSCKHPICSVYMTFYIDLTLKTFERCTTVTKQVQCIRRFIDWQKASHVATTFDCVTTIDSDFKLQVRTR